MTISIQEQMTAFIMKWTPRAAVTLVSGYYGLGIAYEMGWMASVDKVSIQALKCFFGYAGVGAFMPLAQWYSAMAVRVAIGLSAGLVYDVTEKCAIWVYSKWKKPPEDSKGAQEVTLQSEQSV
jgi:hypothetical protein